MDHGLTDGRSGDFILCQMQRKHDILTASCLFVFLPVTRVLKLNLLLEITRFGII